MMLKRPWTIWCSPEERAAIRARARAAGVPVSRLVLDLAFSEAGGRDGEALTAEEMAELLGGFRMLIAFVRMAKGGAAIQARAGGAGCRYPDTWWASCCRTAALRACMAIRCRRSAVRNSASFWKRRGICVRFFPVSRIPEPPCPECENGPWRRAVPGSRFLWARTMKGKAVPRTRPARSRQSRPLPRRLHVRPAVRRARNRRAEATPDRCPHRGSRARCSERWSGEIDGLTGDCAGPG